MLNKKLARERHPGRAPADGSSGLPGHFDKLVLIFGKLLMTSLSGCSTAMARRARCVQVVALEVLEHPTSVLPFNREGADGGAEGANCPGRKAAAAQAAESMAMRGSSQPLTRFSWHEL